MSHMSTEKVCLTMDVFVKTLLSDRVRVAPSDIANNIQTKVMEMTKARMEGRCTRHGYIKPGSIEVIKIAPGTVRMVSLNGDVIFTVYYKAMVCNPQIGSIVQARVTNMNKFGVLAEVYADVGEGNRVPVLEVIVAKQGGSVQSDIDLNSVQLNKVYSIEILGKKYLLNDKKISAIGRIVKSEHASFQNDDTDVEDQEEGGGVDAADAENNSETEQEADEEQEGAADGSEQEKEDSYDDETDGSDFEGFGEEEDFSGGDEGEVDDPDDADEPDDDLSVYSTEGI
jgi:DNA-directed RNA polymerase subunit E'/Rpb7